MQTTLVKTNYYKSIYEKLQFLLGFFLAASVTITSSQNAQMPQLIRWQNIRQGTSYQQRQSEANSCYMSVQDRHKQQQQPSSHTRWRCWWNGDAGCCSRQLRDTEQSTEHSYSHCTASE